MDWISAVLVLTLQRAPAPRIAESITVSASEVLPRLVTPGAVTILDRAAIAAAPTLTLDEALRSVPGFSLFRRSSSRVANPTTQGVTLRGLAASGSSRALVLADDVPLNDPVGGWVYWNRLPAASLDQVEVIRGPAGDLHGADAVGGLVRIRSDSGSSSRALVEGGSDSTARVSGSAGIRVPRALLFGAGEWFHTDGFVVVAPESRGAIDVAASSEHASLHGGALLGRRASQLSVRGSYFDEDRGNGTPFQRNGTVVRQASARLLRAGSASGWSGHAYLVSQDYEQTFSAVLAGRLSERGTSEQRVDASAYGAAFDWGMTRSAVTFGLGASTRTTAADLRDQSLPAAEPPRQVSATQFTGGLAAYATVAASPRMSIAANVRLDAWDSDLGGTAGDGAWYGFLSPRASVTFDAGRGVTIRGALQSGSRGPTINELYRPFRVGSVVTQANAALRPEDVLGYEGSVMWLTGPLTLRALGFWSRVNDAIVNVTLGPAPGNTIVRERRNASRIRARGSELEIDLRIARATALTGSVAYTDSSFTDESLAGLRVPQVPRWHASGGVRTSTGRARLAAEWRFIGRQFDDDRNEFPLDRSTTLDVRAGWRLRPSVEVFGAVENAFDAEQDVGRTPLRTVGLPRTARVGVRLGR